MRVLSPPTAFFAAAMAIMVPEKAAAAPPEAGMKAFCLDPANLRDSHADVARTPITWAKTIENSTLSIGCLLLLKDDGINVTAELKEAVTNLQQNLLDYAMRHDFEISDGSLDGALGPLTSTDFIDIAGYVGFKDVFVNNNYDPESDTAEYLKRFAQEIKKFEPAAFKYAVEQILKEPIAEPAIECTGQPFGYDGICGASSANAAPFAKKYG
jgi:hypothetical protein